MITTPVEMPDEEISPLARIAIELVGICVSGAIIFVIWDAVAPFFWPDAPHLCLAEWVGVCAILRTVGSLFHYRS